MEACAVCGRTLEPGARVCRACGAFALQPEAGRLVGAGARLGAAILEYLLSIALAFVIGLSVGRKLGFSFGSFFLTFVCYWAINFYFWSRGQTLGKLVLGMRVYKTGGEPAGFGTMLVRETVGKFLSSLVFYLGFLWIIFDREHQGWHDKIAGTLVLRK